MQKLRDIQADGFAYLVIVRSHKGGIAIREDFAVHYDYRDTAFEGLVYIGSDGRRLIRRHNQQVDTFPDEPVYVFLLNCVVSPCRTDNHIHVVIEHRLLKDLFVLLQTPGVICTLGETYHEMLRPSTARAGQAEHGSQRQGDY